MTIITTTLSFRAATRYGVAHLAGQPVDCIEIIRVPGVIDFEVRHRTEGRIGYAFHVASVRERGGLYRSNGEGNSPIRPRKRSKRW